VHEASHSFTGGKIKRPVEGRFGRGKVERVKSHTCTAERMKTL
jgi:hypothetical protein